MDDDSDLTSRISDLETNLGLAGEAIGGLLWLVQHLADANENVMSDEAADVMERVDQIRHLLL